MFYYDNEETEFEMDLTDESVHRIYSEFKPISNSQIPHSSLSIGRIEGYIDDIYMKLGYENVGHSGLYDMFYYEGKFNYENYEDILDYYNYVNDQ